MSKYTKSEIRQLVNECISRLKEDYKLTENRVVTFGRKTYPQFGWCVFLSGGSGVGKGYTLNNLIPINGKVINVDHWKKTFAKMNNIDYDSHDTEQVSQLHKAVADKGYKEKYINNLFNPQAHNSKDRP